MHRVMITILFAGLFPALSRGDLMLGPDHFIDRSIKAHGGEKIDKYRAETMQLEGKMMRDGKEIDFKGEFLVQFPGQFKHAVRFETDGVKHETIAVLNGDQGWRRRDGETVAMSAREIAQAKDLMHALRVARLTAIPNDRTFQLTNLNQGSNPSMISSVRAWEIKVTCKGEKDVVLGIGDERKLLLKLERTLQVDEKQVAKIQELYEDYKEINGVMRPTKRTTLIDGKKMVESKASDIKLLAEIDEKEFAKP